MLARFEALAVMVVVFACAGRDADIYFIGLGTKTGEGKKQYAEQFHGYWFIQI